MTLRKLTNTAPAQEALIRIYKSGKAVLNANSSRLLGLTPEALVDVQYDEEAYAARNVRRLYIGKTNGTGHHVKQRRETYCINSTVLCRTMAESLQGYGTYRVCPEDSVTDVSGIRFYNIFFKKYD